MLSRSEGGVVLSNDGRYLTIRLSCGNKVKARIQHSTLKLGSKCHVLFDNSTGDITKVLDYDEPTFHSMPGPEEPELAPDDKECDLLNDIEEEECSRSTEECEDWEHEELELELRSVLGEQRDEG